ncbi:MAG: hypothetical protein ACR2QR_10805 [Woeseiaceae bacterium]
MTIQDWGAIGEMIGGVAIIVSLLYVGLQLKQGNREAKAATLQAALDSEMVLQAEVLRYAGVWNKVQSDATFSDEEEERRGILLFNMMMTVYQNRYYQFQSGYLDDRPDFAYVVSWPMFDIWRASGGATLRSPEFLALLDEARAHSQ